jgi:hypothetical protein
VTDFIVVTGNENTGWVVVTGDGSEAGTGVFMISLKAANIDGSDWSTDFANAAILWRPSRALVQISS